MILCDAHADTLYEMGVNGNKKPVVTEHTLRKGGVSLQVMALWTGHLGNLGDVEGIVAKELAAFDQLLKQGYQQVFSPADAKEDALSVMLSIEGGEVFERGLQTVEFWYQRGVRMAALVWNNVNTLGTPAKLNPRDGLTDYGLLVVKEMQRLKMAVDASHLNEQGFYDLFLKTHVPPLASHSCCNALNPHFRNLTDEQLRLLIQNGGYVGVNFYPAFLSGETATLDDVANHIDHICQMGGEHIVGFGSDFDGIEKVPIGLESPAEFPSLLSRLQERGYSDKSIRRIAGQNLIDYFARIS